MSSKLNDINDLTFYPGNTQPSGAVVTNVTGAPVDMIAHDNQCFAIQNIGTVAGATLGWAGKIQEAITATGVYADIPGATFAPLTSTTGAGIIQAINYQRTLQFVRYVGTISGSASSVALDVVIAGQKKQL